VKAMDMVANPKETEAIVEHQEVANKEAAVETIVILKDQCGDQQPAVGCHNPCKGRPRTVLYREPLKVGCSGRDDGHSRNSTAA
jgi:hypothetical protein